MPSPLTQSVPTEVNRGRPRNPQTHEAILEAARELLRHQGVGGFSIEQVAASAGVSKTSIYRRWATKGALLVELYMEGLPPVIVENASSIRIELERYLMATVDRIQDPLWDGILRSLVAEAQYDPSTAALLREQVVMPRRASGLKLLEYAAHQGQITDGLDHELVIDLLFGPLWYRLLFGHGPLDREFAARLLKQVEPILYGKKSGLPAGSTRRKR
jgi:AcrR family transcriptional regulator